MTEFPQLPQLVYTSKSKTLITTTTTSKFSTYACIRIHACVRIYIYKKTGKMPTCMQVDVLTVANRQSDDHLWVVGTLPVGHFTGRKSGLHFAEKISSRHFAGKIQSSLCRKNFQSSLCRKNTVYTLPEVSFLESSFWQSSFWHVPEEKPWGKPKRKTSFLVDFTSVFP